MRSRNAANEHVAEVARRRLELLSAELAGLRPSPVDTPEPSGPDRPGEPTSAPAPGRHAQRRAAPAGRLAGWLHDRLPPTLQGRVQLGTSHLTVVALLVAAALATSAWFVLRADRGTVLREAHRAPRTGLLVTPAAGPTPGDSPAGPAPPVASPSATRLVVDVAGKVRRPGIVTLPAGARVVDALKAAGGVRRHVDLSSLNLARLVVDGEQILVGLPPPAGVAASAASAPGAAPTARMVNLNTATEPELESLPGVGPVTAAAILKWRSEHGPFTAVDQLLDVSGIGDATLAEIAPFVTL